MNSTSQESIGLEAALYTVKDSMGDLFLGFLFPILSYVFLDNFQLKVVQCENFRQVFLFNDRKLIRMLRDNLDRRDLLKVSYRFKKNLKRKFFFIGRGLMVKLWINLFMGRQNVIGKRKISGNLNEQLKIYNIKKFLNFTND